MDISKRKKSVPTAKIVDSDEEDSEAKVGDLQSSEEWRSLHPVKIHASNEELRTSGSGEGVAGGGKPAPTAKTQGGEGEAMKEEEGVTVGGATGGGRGRGSDRKPSRRKKKKSRRGSGMYVVEVAK